MYRFTRLLPVSVECQDLPPGKTNHILGVMNVALGDAGALCHLESRHHASASRSKLHLGLHGHLWLQGTVT